MGINFKQIFYSSSPYHTILIGRYIGKQLVSGNILMLKGNLGSGKTTFVKGLADALQVPNTEYVNSPTYNLIHEYRGLCNIYHVDLYRLDYFIDLEDIGLIEIFDSKGITFVEWPERIRTCDLPIKYLNVYFNIDSSFRRRITVLPNKFFYSK